MKTFSSFKDFLETELCIHVTISSTEAALACEQDRCENFFVQFVHFSYDILPSRPHHVGVSSVHTLSPSEGHVLNHVTNLLSFFLLNCTLMFILVFLHEPPSSFSSSLPSSLHPPS